LHAADLADRRRQIVLILKAERTRLHKASPEIDTLIDKHIEWMVDEAKRVEADIQDLLYNQPEMKRKSDIVRSGKGIGQVASSELVAGLQELGELDRKRLPLTSVWFLGIAIVGKSKEIGGYLPPPRRPAKSLCIDKQKERLKDNQAKQLKDALQNRRHVNILFFATMKYLS
jgi:hypothetical protein